MPMKYLLDRILDFAHNSQIRVVPDSVQMFITEDLYDDLVEYVEKYYSYNRWDYTDTIFFYHHNIAYAVTRMPDRGRFVNIMSINGKELKEYYTIPY